MCEDTNSSLLVEGLLIRDPAVDERLIKTGVLALQLVARIRASIDLRPSGFERRLAQLCQAFFLGKIYLVTRAILTLIDTGQQLEAVNLLREQYEFIVALLYFQMNEREATLFTASHPIAQVELGMRSVKCAVNRDEENRQQAAVAECEVEADASRARFPELTLPCPGASCREFGTLHKHNWSVRAPKDMLRALVQVWLTDGYARIGHPYTRSQLHEQVNLITERYHFYHSHYLSQDKHGLPFAMPKSLTLEEYRIADAEGKRENPNAIIYHTLGSLDPIYTDTITNNRIADFGGDIADFRSRLAADRQRLGITDGNPSIAAIREVGLSTAGLKGRP